MRPLTFTQLSDEVAAAALNAMPDWWTRIDSDPKWRAYSEWVAGLPSVDSYPIDTTRGWCQQVVCSKLEGILTNTSWAFTPVTMRNAGMDWPSATAQLHWLRLCS